MQAPDEKKRQVKCPRCSKPALFTQENPHRPFCSERCKIIDLGAWAEEKYAIPASVQPELEENTDQDRGSAGDPESDKKH